MTPVKAVPTTEKFNELASILVLTINEFGNRRQVEAEQVTSKKIDHKVFNFTGKLIIAPEWSDVKSKIGDIRRYIDAVSLPSPFKQGTYTIPNATIGEAQERLEGYREELKSLIATLASALPRIEKDMVKAYRESLGKEFDEASFRAAFPDRNEILSAFDVRWSWVDLAAPGTLKSISATLYEEEKRKIAKQWNDALVDMRIVLRGAMADLLDETIKKLAGKKDGKPKIFRDTVITNLNDFFDTFDPRNQVAQDSELQKVVAKARKLIDGVNPKDMRDDEDLRKKIAQGFTAIKKQMDGMMIDRPKRGIMFED